MRSAAVDCVLGRGRREHQLLAHRDALRGDVPAELGGKQVTRALQDMAEAGVGAKDIVTDDALHNAMVVHAAFGGSTNLILHIPAIMHAAALRRPVAADWARGGATRPAWSAC